jgi:GAF domain-containing protein/HAMP domain-containing protein
MMTEAIEQPQASKPLEVRSALRRVILVPVICILTGLGLFGFYFWQLAFWQFAASAAGLATALILVVSGYLLANKKWPTLGGWLILTGMLLPFAVFESFYSSVTIYMLAGGSLTILAGTSLVLRRGKWSGWLWLPVFLSFIWYVNTYWPINRFPADQNLLLWGYMVATSSLIALAAIFQALLSTQISSIRTRLLLASVTLVIVPMAVLTLVSTSLVRQNSQLTSRQELAASAASLSEQIDNWFQSLRTNLVIEVERSTETGSLVGLLSSVPGTPDFENAYQAQRQRFVDTIRLRRTFEELLVLDRNGIVRLSTNPQRENTVNASLEFFRSGMKGPFIQAQRSESSVNPINVTVALPIVDQKGQTLGVIAGRTGMENIRRIIESGMGSGSTEIYLVGNDGVLLTPLRAENAPTMGFPIHTEGVNLAMSSKSEGVASYENSLGVPVIGAYEWLPQLEAALLSERNLGDINQSANRIAVLNAGLAAVMILLAVLAALLVTRSIANPIAELDQTARKIAAGDTQIRAVVTSQDEIGRLAGSFNEMTDQLGELIGNLENRVQERTLEIEKRSAQIAGAAEVGSYIASIHQIDALLSQVTLLISEKFGFYHVGIFLLDEAGEYAVLRAANSEGGQRMLARGHKLAVGQTGIVGYVTAQRQPRIALDVGQDAVFFNNPDLPDTHSEMAVPLISSGELLGALDVQSTAPDAFTQEDIEILQLLADQVATAFQNAQLFASVQQALQAAHTAYGELSQRAWIELLEETPEIGFQSASEQVEFARSVWKPESEQALTTGEIVQGNGAAHTLALPIKIRDVVIGVIDTYKHIDSGDWTEEEVSTLKNITSQLGVALESARLYEETQFRAESERLVGEITAHIRETMDVDYVLQTAAQEIREALNLAEVEIRLEPTDDTDD